MKGAGRETVLLPPSFFFPGWLPAGHLWRTRCERCLVLSPYRVAPSLPSTPALWQWQVSLAVKMDLLSGKQQTERERESERKGQRQTENEREDGGREGEGRISNGVQWTLWPVSLRALRLTLCSTTTSKTRRAEGGGGVLFYPPLYLPWVAINSTCIHTQSWPFSNSLSQAQTHINTHTHTPTSVIHTHTHLYTFTHLLIYR